MALGIAVRVGVNVGNGGVVCVTVAATGWVGDAVAGAQLPSRRVVKINRKANRFIMSLSL